MKLRTLDIAKQFAEFNQRETTKGDNKMETVILKKSGKKKVVKSGDTTTTRITKDTKVMVGAYITEKLQSRLDAYSKQNGVKKTFILEQAIDDYLNGHEG